MKKIGVLGVVFLLAFVLSGCGGNKLRGNWVKYSDYSEKEKTVWEIEKDEKKIIETEYSKDQKNDVTVVNLEVNKDKELMTISMGELTETLPYSLKDDKLTVDNETMYKEGSKAEKQAREKAKNSRLKSEKEDDEEAIKKEKAAKKERAYNKNISSLEKRLNEDFKNKYQGNWYLGEGIDTESFYPSASVEKLTFVGDKISIQKTRITAMKDQDREVSKGDVSNYTFSGITLPKKNDYDESNSDSYSSDEYELPETGKEIEEIKTIEDFAKYEKEHNIRKIVFNYQSNGGNMSDSQLVLNVNDLTNIIPGDSFSDDTYRKELPKGIQESDFDI